jgi:hypothetical protein
MFFARARPLPVPFCICTGGVEDLRARLGEHMIATGDARLLSEGSAPVAAGVAPIPAAAYGA